MQLLQKYVLIGRLLREKWAYSVDGYDRAWMSSTVKQKWKHTEKLQVVDLIRWVDLISKQTREAVNACQRRKLNIRDVTRRHWNTNQWTCRSSIPKLLWAIVFPYRWWTWGVHINIFWLVIIVYKSVKLTCGIHELTKSHLSCPQGRAMYSEI